jgi:hypothetical protein
MKDKMGAELVKQHNLELERQEAVARVFQLEEELKRVREARDLEITELNRQLRMAEEGLSLAGEDLNSFKFNQTKRTEDKGTETIATTADLGPPSQPSSRRTSVAAIRIPRPKATKGGKLREESGEGGDKLDEQGEAVDEIGETLASTRRKSSSSSKKPKPILTNPSGAARRPSALPKTPQSLDKLLKGREVSPSVKKERRNTEFFPNKAKNLTSLPATGGRKSSNPDPGLAASTAGVPELSPNPTGAEDASDELSPLAEDSRSTSARLLPSYSRARSKSFQLEVSDLPLPPCFLFLPVVVMLCREPSLEASPRHCLAKSPWRKMSGWLTLLRRKRSS